MLLSKPTISLERSFSTLKAVIALIELDLVFFEVVTYYHNPLPENRFVLKSCQCTWGDA